MLFLSDSLNPLAYFVGNTNGFFVGLGLRRTVRIGWWRAWLQSRLMMTLRAFRGSLMDSCEHRRFLSITRHARLEKTGSNSGSVGSQELVTAAEPEIPRRHSAKRERRDWGPIRYSITHILSSCVFYALRSRHGGEQLPCRPACACTVLLGPNQTG